MVVYLANAFSINMLEKPDAYLRITKIDKDSARAIIRKAIEEHNFESVIGHEATAKLLSQLLGINIEANRKAIKVKENDTIIVCQIKERLPEGKILSLEEIKKLYDQGKIDFYQVEVSYSGWY